MTPAFGRLKSLTPALGRQRGSVGAGQKQDLSLSDGETETGRKQLVAAPGFCSSRFPQYLFIVKIN